MNSVWSVTCDLVDNNSKYNTVTLRQSHCYEIISQPSYDVILFRNVALCMVLCLIDTNFIQNRNKLSQLNNKYIHHARLIIPDAFRNPLKFLTRFDTRRKIITVLISYAERSARKHTVP